MVKRYEHNGYTLIWSNSGGKAYDMGGYYVFDKDGKVVLHATTTATPLTEEEAIKQLDDMPEFLELINKIIIDEEYVEKRNEEVQRLIRGEK